jgi:hypothetical protein
MTVIARERRMRPWRSHVFMRLLQIMLCMILAMTPVLAEEALQEIVVNPGDTMWAISKKYLKDPQKWPEIVKYNKLPTSDPTMALPGTRIKVPVTLIKEEFRSAQIIRLQPEVRYRKKADNDWKPATALMTLGYEDSVRTMKGGSARVRFPTREEIQINENSLVVLKPDRMTQEVQMLQGDIRASRAKVVMPNGTVVKPRVASDYSARIREDKTEVVFVYKGEVDVTAQGKTVRVPEGYGTVVPDKAPPSVPQPLPSFPDFNPIALTQQSPGSHVITPKISAPPPIDTRPASSGGSSGNRAKSVASENLMVNYRIQLAKDPKFGSILLEKTDKIGTAFDIRKQNIADGTYYIRIAFIDAFGSQSAWSSPTQAIRDTVPPVITSLTPENNTRFTGEESYCDVVGFAKDAAAVTVNGDLVFVNAEGRFTRFVTLKPGVNKITVVARDTQGNDVTIERKVEYAPGR